MVVVTFGVKHKKASVVTEELYVFTEEHTGKVAKLVEGNGLYLDLFQLRVLWKELFPTRDTVLRDNDTWRMFKQLELDPVEDTVTTAQLILYLDSLATATRDHVANVPLRQTIWEIVGYGRKSSILTKRCAAVYTVFIQSTILLSVVLLIIGSMPSNLDHDGSTRTDTTAYSLETLTIVVFTLDLLLTLWSFPTGPIRYVKNVWFWIDVGSVLPYYLSAMGVVSDSAKSLQVLKVLRMGMKLTQVLRVVKLGKRSNGMALVVASLQNAREQVFLMLLATMMTVTLCGSLLFYAEKEEASFDFDTQKWMRDINSSLPDAGNVIFFQSIPDTFWFEWVSLSTVGYGDQYPVTAMGKAVSSITMLSSLFVIGYPTTIMMSSFIQEYSTHKNRMDHKQKRDRLIMNMKKSLATHPTPSAPNPPCISQHFLDSLGETSHLLEETSKRVSCLRRKSSGCVLRDEKTFLTE
eukprot:TRINITY_DN5718_c0_g1_i1.p1 TRINITY_DN5718_c0_g1~~TRINITY_DN5718_c0_g1_i1.p1  ORF type:complete len:464 (+),score=63.77 TRINITY_DN5718_c0_g1_i1:74-1465(+)